MGATRVPVITNPGNDPGRNQTPKRNLRPSDADGGYPDSESMVENPGGAATTRCMWATEADEMADRNGRAPRDRGNRST